MSAPTMVKAILSGAKSQTRRIVKGHPLTDAKHWVPDGGVWWCVENDLPCGPFRCPYGKPGERLWVRETFKPIPAMRPSGYFSNPKLIGKDYWYRATDDLPTWGEGPWKPSIFMPRVASRITLEITDVRVERLAEISEEDAKAEGVQCPQSIASDRYWPTFKDGFRTLWQSINGAGSWEQNLWVWAVSFRRIDAERDG